MKTTHFPCVKGSMGDWTYYLTVMRFTDIVKYVKFANEVCPNDDLDLMIQREISNRSKQIADYLKSQDQRFFGSLIIAAYDGEPKFRSITLDSSSVLETLNILDDKIGILQFDGSEEYYVVDGQHRLSALKEVIKDDAERYKNDEVSVIVICHSKDSIGMTRARRLFTTVNRYAKKTSKSTNIVMDEDDGIAVVTRRILREDAFFRNRVKVRKRNQSGEFVLATGEAMKPPDRNYLMAIGTFYECNKYLLPQELLEDYQKKQQLPAFDLLEAGFTAISDRWHSIIDSIQALKELEDDTKDLSNLRKDDGGHILARPVGMYSFIKAVGIAIERDIPIGTISRCVQGFESISSTPWDGLLWNSSGNTMLYGAEQKKVATEVWAYLFGISDDFEAVNEKWKNLVDPQNQQPDLRLPDLHP